MKHKVIYFCVLDSISSGRSKFLNRNIDRLIFESPIK